MGDAGLAPRRCARSLAEAAGLAGRLPCRWAVSKRAASLRGTVSGTSSGLGDEPGTGDAPNLAADGRHASWCTSSMRRRRHVLLCNSVRALGDHSVQSWLSKMAMLQLSSPE